MKKNLAKNYFSKLLNSNIDENTILKLSSSQKARAHAWLKSNNFNAGNLLLKNVFTIQEIISGVRNESAKDDTSAPKNKRSDPSSFSDNNKPIGIDIQNISELFPEGIPEDSKSDPELLGIFTIKELTYAQSKENPLQTLTGLFAAKEAVQKCLEDNLNLTDIEILSNKNGKPNTAGFLISISHSQDYAVAIALMKENKLINEKIIPPKEPLMEKKSALDLVIPTLVGVLLLLEIVRFF